MLYLLLHQRRHALHKREHLTVLVTTCRRGFELLYGGVFTVIVVYDLLLGGDVTSRLQVFSGCG